MMHTHVESVLVLTWWQEQKIFGWTVSLIGWLMSRVTGMECNA
jgi:hypothetical protein